MIIGAYSFCVTDDIKENYDKILVGIEKAKENNVRFIAFCECSLTGYPPAQTSWDKINFHVIDDYLNRVRSLAVKNNIYITVGSVIKEDDAVYNAMICYAPNGERNIYCKRALGGWDKDSFTVGNSVGILNADEYKIGIRICYEVRFPEYFRELYDKVDCAVVCFSDSKTNESTNRYNTLKAHLMTRACENILPMISVNCCNEYQTAPTAAFDKDGDVISELKRHTEGLLTFELTKTENTFSQNERKKFIDSL